MSSSTVGELFAAWEGCVKEARVWEHLRDTLDKVRRLGQGEEEAVIIRMKDGRAVEPEVLMRVQAEIDGLIADLDDQAKSIKAQQVGK